MGIRMMNQAVNVLYRAVDPHSFVADLDPVVFLNADPDSAFKTLYKISFWNEEFSVVEKIEKIAQKQKQWSMYKITLKIWKNYNNYRDLFPSIFKFLLKNFTLLNPDLHDECGSGSRRKNDCGSMRIRIHSSGYDMVSLKSQNSLTPQPKCGGSASLW